MKDYDKNKESSHLKYWEVNNLYEWAVSQKFPVNGFKWVENTSQFDKDIGKSFNEESDEDTLLKFILNIQKNCMKLIMIYHFYQKEWKLTNLKNVHATCMIKKEFVLHIRNLKQGLNHGLVLEKVRRVIKFNQKTWLKPYIDMNTELGKKSENNFEK